jgi:hypothetical protein
MADPTGRAIGSYFGRVFAHYSAGGFADEYGSFRPSYYNYSIPYWSVARTRGCMRIRAHAHLRLTVLRHRLQGGFE